MDEKDYKIHCRTAKALYQRIKKVRDKAVQEENWNIAGDQTSYLQGMIQIMIVFGYYDYDEE